MLFSYMLVGAIFILIGLILLTRKKFMVSKMYDASLITLIWISGIRFRAIDSMSYYHYIISIGMIIFFWVTFRGKYTLYNVNKEMVSAALTSILKEKNIAYKKIDDSFVLEDNDNKSISYNQSLNTVEIDLKHIKNLPFYEEIKQGLINKIKEIDKRLFPFIGIGHVLFGIVVIVVVQNFLK
ncbi:hypothetical protein SAMN05446037_102424 [Anaerovirgula multivorans]|uniref:Uncharacterized protein n=1 Tax=Anaerovirgula multivorans TaxID=312168 RepID=A0A239HW09_9FIRM|nr:hypothetical protein [Anaerovirgula multivorans]SNS85431.1 hypothetical protein SAMN05446037_102424 [Anaerovirgula multivorans]